ncbi:MAG: hypothetical protein KBA31_18145 [Alphaproteobacteria bacterium]|nr:hypothetical protein [Alphaproteobacteria bacterium]
MTLEELYYISQIVAVIAIFASLIFVGIQLRQNTRAVLVSTSQTHFTMWTSVASPLVEDADIARIYWQALSDFDGLTDQDRMRFIVYMSNVFRFYESSRIQWRRGVLEAEHWHSVEVNIRAFATQPGVKRFWKIRRHWHSPEFARWFESLPSEVQSPIYDQGTPVTQKFVSSDLSADGKRP